MLTDEILRSIVCPQTHQPLTWASDEIVERVNALAKEGKLKNRGGGVAGEIEKGLLREDGEVLYPVRAGVPNLLADEGIDVPE